MPLKGIEPLLFGMSLEEAEAAMGPSDRVYEKQHEASWRPGWRCYFSEDWALVQISIVDAKVLPIQIEGLTLSPEFDQAERQLVLLTGQGFRDPMEHLTVFPSRGLEIWSEEGKFLDDFGCTTPEQCDVQWPDWSTKYILVALHVQDH
jgi:hypothetical protein